MFRCVTFVFSLCLGFSVSTALMSSESVDDAIGMWAISSAETNSKTRVEIYECGGAYCGKITSSDEPQLVGTVIFNDMLKSGASYIGGTVADTSSGKAYEGKLLQLDANTLKVSICVASILCRSQMWFRP